MVDHRRRLSEIRAPAIGEEMDRRRTNEERCDPDYRLLLHQTEADFSAVLRCTTLEQREYDRGPMAAESPEKLIASNKKAFHEYFVLQKVEAGLELTGTEVKSLRDGRANLKDSYVIVKAGEAFLLGLHISP